MRRANGGCTSTRGARTTIKGLRSVTFKEGAEDFVVDKDPGLEHWCDGLGYLILRR